MSLKRPYHFCHSCGSPYEPHLIGSLELPCAVCGMESYRNPTPVSVVLIPFEDGVITVRRNIEPRKGKIALPGGFIVLGESWRVGGAREAHEEAQVVIEHPDSAIAPLMIESIPNGTQIIIFGQVVVPDRMVVHPFVPNVEATERFIVTRNNFDLYKDEFAFPLHIKAVERYFEEK